MILDLTTGGSHDEAVEYVSRWGGRCRDCADENGSCPSSGLPCEPDDADKIIRHVLTALHYGIRHGYLPSITGPHPVTRKPSSEGDQYVGKSLEEISGRLA